MDWNCCSWFFYVYRKCVLPLTREWIEIIMLVNTEVISRPFSLLRGSGLKLDVLNHLLCGRAVLPLTREWIEMSLFLRSLGIMHCSPSYEGVDWNISKHIKLRGVIMVLPLTREWIEIAVLRSDWWNSYVLPLTREWIEMQGKSIPEIAKSFSLLRGSGLKLFL